VRRHGSVLKIVEEIGAEVLSFLPIVLSGLLLAPDAFCIFVAKSEDIAATVKSGESYSWCSMKPRVSMM
jgi:hypothetical protein